jgi:hypothetical protein
MGPLRLAHANNLGTKSIGAAKNIKSISRSRIQGIIFIEA